MIDKEFLEKRVIELQQQRERAVLTVHVVDGALQEVEHLLKSLQNVD